MLLSVQMWQKLYAVQILDKMTDFISSTAERLVDERGGTEEKHSIKIQERAKSVSGAINKQSR